MKTMRTFVVLLAAAAAVAQAQEKTSDLPLIVVTGNGESRTAPDLATLRVGVQAQAKTAQEAQSQASAIGTRALAAIRKLGIEARDIQTSGLSLFPVFSEVRPGQQAAPQIVGYRAQNTVTVRITDLSKVGPVVDATVTAGANEIQSLDFGLRNDRAARQAALKDAVSDARAKAEAMAEALGVRLGDLQEAVEGGAQMEPVRYRMAAADMAATPIAAGEVGVNASVTLRFRIVKR